MLDGKKTFKDNSLAELRAYDCMHLKFAPITSINIE